MSQNLALHQKIGCWTLPSGNKLDSPMRSLPISDAEQQRYPGLHSRRWLKTGGKVHMWKASEQPTSLLLLSPEPALLSLHLSAEVSLCRPVSEDNN